MDTKVITLDGYQTEAATLMREMPEREAILMCTIGMCGEAGEVSELIKKWAFRGKQFDKTDLMLELGDVLWYLSNLANLHGLSLEDVAQANLVKLEARKNNKEGAHAGTVHLTR